MELWELMQWGGDHSLNHIIMNEMRKAQTQNKHIDQDWREMGAKPLWLKNNKTDELSTLLRGSTK